MIVTLRGLIVRYPMSAFFTLAFGLSWLAWSPYVLGMNGLGWEPEIRFPAVLGTSQILGVLPGAYLGPIFAAFVVTAVAEGRPGLRRWAGRLVRFRVPWPWYVLTIISVPVALGVATLPFSGGAVRMPPVAVLVAFVPGLVLQMVTTGLAEEPGWRDFALPRLQPRYGALRGNLILGPLWGAWHLPLFFSEWGGRPDVPWYVPVEFVLTTFAFSLVMTWVFNRTGQSLPLAMLLHTSVNNFFSTAWSAMFPGVGPHGTTHVFLLASAVAAAVLLVATRGRLGWVPERVGPVSPAGRPSAQRS